RRRGGRGGVDLDEADAAELAIEQRGRAEQRERAGIDREQVTRLEALAAGPGVETALRARRPGVGLLAGGGEETAEHGWDSLRGTVSVRRLGGPDGVPTLSGVRAMRGRERAEDPAAAVGSGISSLYAWTDIAAPRGSRQG